MNKGKKVSAKVKKKKTKPARKDKGKKDEIQQKVPTEESQAEKPPVKKDTKAFEQLGCMCCSKQLWVKDPAGQLIPGCSCALYLPGHNKCEKCNLHCTCEGRVHG